MGVLSILLLVFFIVVAILLVLLVLVQNEDGDSLGGIFAGGSSSAFGSRSGNVLTRATTILGASFLILSLGLALINRTPGGTGVESAARQLSSDANRNWWQEPEPEAPSPEPSDAESAGLESPLTETQDVGLPDDEPADDGLSE
ncbi:MAG: preprotein translocase subunit SecG [Treponema sp.]|jgi:preprotein translocase subunit SecG|nr:preprotein translocase subunit SecG [Treponema sp.]